MASFVAFRGTTACLRRARVTIPRLSPTHSQARILKFCPSGLDRSTSAMDASATATAYLECTDALFVLECSPDLVTEGFREVAPDGTEVLPKMIVETHDEGEFSLSPEIRLETWYSVGETIGIIDDEDEDFDDDDGDDNKEIEDEWLWQAYSYQEGEEGRELNLPPHIAKGKLGR